MAVNLTPILNQTKNRLEQQAASQFGAAVADFAKNSLGAALGNTSTSIRNTRDPNRPPSRPQGAQFIASSYAAALAGGTSYRPKLKFLFNVEFVFTPYAVQQFPDLFGGEGANDFTFMVKAVDRPKIDFEYEDDVNMYNFRTKVLKKIRHRELTITFLDDTGNRVINFFRGLMMLNSPITRRQLMRDGSTTPPDPSMMLGDAGMAFSKGATEVNAMDSAMRGVINNEYGNVIQTIRVKQLFVDSGADVSTASKEIIYDFINARIVSFDLDDLSHEQSEASMMTMQFDYDWMEIVDVGPLAVMDGPHYAIAVPGSTAPISMSPLGNGLPLGSTAKTNSPFANIVAGAFSQAATSLTSSAVNKAVQSIAGKGIFGQIIGQQAANAVSGIIGSAARDISTKAAGAMSSIATNFVNDSASGLSRAVGVVKSGSDSVGNFFSNLSL